MRLFLLATIFVAVVQQSHALDNGVALTPPMGWLSWTRFLCNTDCKKYPNECISESLIKSQALRMALDGYKDAGYEYVIIDDCWPAKQRDSNGKLIPDPDRFPSGMKALADYVHSLGLKFGIYEDVGTNTCAGYPGSFQHYQDDADTFAEWGVDYVKFDGCNQDPEMFNVTYPTMTQALNSTGRRMVFSCEWPLYQNVNNLKPDYAAISENCNMWRADNDIHDSWSSVTGVIERMASAPYQPFVRPGAWNDPDMLVIGNFGLSEDEEKAQMAMWAITSAPLLMSNDLRSVRASSKAILTNSAVIAVNQDKLGVMGKRVLKDGALEYWTKPIKPEGSFAIVFLNLNDQGSSIIMSKSLADLGISSSDLYDVTELFDGKKIGKLAPDDILSYPVNPSGVAMFTAKVSI